jgi:hypothetical protein
LFKIDRDVLFERGVEIKLVLENRMDRRLHAEKVVCKGASARSNRVPTVLLWRKRKRGVPFLIAPDTIFFIRPMSMRIWKLVRRPWLIIALLLVAASGGVSLAYLCWSPGERIRDGRHDLRSNGIWIQHGWLGHDSWFVQNRRDKAKFRSDEKIQELADLLSRHGVEYVFPHLCPCDPGGSIASVDPRQAERFLEYFEDFKVIPWVGGLLGVHCFLESGRWRAEFVSSVGDLLRAYSRLAGIQVNIEPLPNGNPDFLLLLEELRNAMPDGSILSVAAYPPPTQWHPFPRIHWEEDYFRRVAERVDLLAPMMYDTALRLPKLYQFLISTWTSEVLDWSGDTQVLLGIPAYDDAGVGYHFPEVENLENALLGIHAGLSSCEPLPENYRGVAIYCEWEMDLQEWSYLKKEFEKSP